MSPIEASLLAPLRRLFVHEAPKPLVQEAEHQVALKGATTAAPKIGADSYNKAVARLNRRIDAEKVLQGPNAKGKYRLMPHDESLLRTQPGPTAKGTVLAFHGFTAGPWQYEELADRLTKEGYNVYAPRLPGHGFATPDGKVTNAGFVDAAHRGKYEGYIDARYAEAEALGAPVYTLGLSGGTDLALRAAEKHPEVKGVFAMAPFLGPNLPLGAVYKVLAFLDRVTFGLFGKFMDHVPEGKNGLAIDEGVTPHNHPTFGQGLASEQVGAKVKKVDAPIQFVTTDHDSLAGTEEVGPMYLRTGGAAKNGWFHFGPDEHIPHAMISPHENPSPAAVTKLQQMVVDFLDGKLTFRRPPGKT